MIEEKIQIKGLSASGGEALGKLFFYRREKTAVDPLPRYDKVLEWERWLKAKNEVAAGLEREERRLGETVGKEEASVFLVHRMMLDDADFTALLAFRIDKGHAAEYALQQAVEALTEELLATKDDYMAARALDMRDLGERALFALGGKEKQLLPKEAVGVILCAEELTPSETVTLDRASVAAFLLSGGSVNSHTAILARSMGVPAIVALGEALYGLPEGQEALVDADGGVVTVCPDEACLAAFEERQRSKRAEREAMEAMKHRRILTKQGRAVQVYGNIGTPEEADEALQEGGEGIGLFRSEFLFLGRDFPPDEEEQFTAYQRVLAACEGKRVVVRTLDVGADKQVDYLDLDEEENPALGLRGIRLCLARPSLFRTQLRALLRASAFGRLALLFPMIASLDELARAKAILKEEAEALELQGVPFSYEIEIGIMIETPAAAILSDLFAAEVDFFSVGTNDLSQYTLAIDRQNSLAADFFDPHHEAVLRLVALAAENAHKNGIWIGICGELAADLSLTERFLAMQIDELSVAPPAILPLKARLVALCEKEE